MVLTRVSGSLLFLFISLNVFFFLFSDVFL